MIDHMGIHTGNFPAAKTFYDAVFAALGGSLLKAVPLEYTGGNNIVGYGRDNPVFWVHEGQGGTGQHFAFSARNHAEVAAFYKAALANGGTDNGAPGPRPHYHENYYGAFVIDPDGNNVEAVCHRPE